MDSDSKMLLQLKEKQQTQQRCCECESTFNTCACVVWRKQHLLSRPTFLAAPSLIRDCVNMIRVRPLEKMLANPGKQVEHLDLSSFKKPRLGDMTDASQQEQKEEAPSRRGSFGGSGLSQSIGHPSVGVHSTAD
ncbi:Hypothetical predicted protein [Cloeon dipterum]|uniref:Uncharacterized protein n=1 Tax=Cloeon dipterum TaxID=197152 RepID=A0A8S1CDK8_9INSE|nr:Hypothetical predicted protein [Cloeon dipterum]